MSAPRQPDYLPRDRCDTLNVPGYSGWYLEHRRWQDAMTRQSRQSWGVLHDEETMSDTWIFVWPQRVGPLFQNKEAALVALKMMASVRP